MFTILVLRVCAITQCACCCCQGAFQRWLLPSSKFSLWSKLWTLSNRFWLPLSTRCIVPTRYVAKCLTLITPTPGLTIPFQIKVKKSKLRFEKTSLSDTRPQDPFGWSHGSLMFGDGEGLLAFTSACSGRQAERCRCRRAL
jgi:hypothetical protein